MSYTPMYLRSRPTIVDVARMCGVTPATVSRVLNRKPHFSTSDAVRERIFETAKKLGYVPDLAARNLNRRSTRIIGVFSAPHTSFTWGINQSLLGGSTSILHAKRFDVFFEVSSPNKLDHALPFWRFDGAILFQSPKAEIVAELDNRKVPYVCINEQLGTPVASVLADDLMGIQLAAKHLFDLGHRKIAYANARTGYLPHYSVAERHGALLEQATSLGMQLVPGHDREFPTAEEFVRLAVKDGGATGVITYDHTIAVSILGAAARMGLSIPRDFSVICFNDEFPAAEVAPALTAVAVSGKQMGTIGAEILLEALNGAKAPAARVVRVPESLLVRDSTGPAPRRA